MSVPAFVQAGTGIGVISTTSTVSLTGATAGNLICLFMLHVGTPEGAWSRTNRVNLANLAGTAAQDTNLINSVSFGAPTAGSMDLFVGRAIANGTVSWDVTAPAVPVLARLFEFSGESAGTTDITVFENGAGVDVQTSGSGAPTTSVTDRSVETTGANRLALNFVGISSDQATVAFTGASGGTWTEPVAEYRNATYGGTIQLQTATLTAATTIDGGSYAVSSTSWGIIGTAIIPLPAQTVLPDADLATAGWVTAPLFSKLNDGSDATVITATAS